MTPTRRAAPRTTPKAGKTAAARRTPRPRVVLGIMLILVFVSLLLVEAYISAEFAEDGTPSAGRKQDKVPASVIEGGPIINTTNGQVQSLGMPAKTIALTFDDGPDPRWTPQILQVLRENQITATFFVVGSQVARYPDLAKQTVAQGNELGLHTFTHPNLEDIAPWQRRLQYNQTQTAIARAAGVTSSLIRFPYSSRADAIDDDNWPLVTEAGALGYLVIVNDTDSRDWSRPGVDTIISSATPQDGTSAVVLMHDAGGDRTQTVAALRRFIPQMKAKGYTFTTVSGGLNAAAAAGGGHRATVVQNPPASHADQWRGAALVATVKLADIVVYLLAGLFVIVGILFIARTALLLVLAGRHARRRRSQVWSWGPAVTEPVSVIVPAYNEKEGIEAAVRSLANGDYPDSAGGVVDDGATDDTAALVEGLGLPNVKVVRVPNGGKSNALNTGVALARHDLIVMVDGDTVFEPESVRLLVQPFADPEVGAVAGNVKVGNRLKLVAKWQHIEYVIGFNLDRRLYETLQCMPTVPGAIGGFRRQALAQVGGMSDETLAEDTDVTIALTRLGWKVVYEQNARAWTEAPATLGQLYKQRYRWSYGTIQAMWKHRKALTDSGASGRFGRRGLPFLALFGVALPLLAPVMDILLVYGLMFWDQTETVVAWLAMLGLQMITAVIAFRMDKEELRPLWALPFQQLAYRQLMYLVLIQSVMSAMTGARMRWHKLHRAGLGQPASTPRPVAPPPPDPRPVPTLGYDPALGYDPPTDVLGYDASLGYATQAQPVAQPAAEPSIVSVPAQGRVHAEPSPLVMQCELPSYPPPDLAGAAARASAGVPGQMARSRPQDPRPAEDARHSEERWPAENTWPADRWAADPWADEPRFGGRYADERYSDHRSD